MNCNQVHDLILTDYLDDRLSGTKLNELKAHLSGCLECREFERVARQAAVEPFEGLSKVKTPEAVWENIREFIMEEETRPVLSYWGVLWGRWRNIFGARPAVAWAGVFSMVILSLVVVQHISRQRSVQLKDKEQVEYLAFLMGYPDTVSMEGDSGYGTDIEAMFL